MGVIKILESQVANKIAAGEVVQRPASAVKELLENSIDSKADEIILSFYSGGNKMFQVSDNGCGMDIDDLNLCVKRHATSKIKTSQDLNNIKTMGFRGEALASISEISIMEIKTKSKDHDIGNRVYLILDISKKLSHLMLSKVRPSKLKIFSSIYLLEKNFSNLKKLNLNT